MNEALQVILALYVTVTLVTVGVGGYKWDTAEYMKEAHLGKLIMMTCVLWPVWAIIALVHQIKIVLAYYKET